MKHHNSKFFYQPSLLLSMISWSWTFIVLLIGFIFWLEVTVLQWISYTCFILFLIIAILEISQRIISIKNNQLIIKRLFKKKSFTIDINDISQIKPISKHQILLKAHHQSYYFLLRKNSAAKLLNIINSRTLNN